MTDLESTIAAFNAGARGRCRGCLYETGEMGKMAFDIIWQGLGCPGPSPKPPHTCTAEREQVEAVMLAFGLWVANAEWGTASDEAILAELEAKLKGVLV